MKKKQRTVKDDVSAVVISRVASQVALIGGCLDRNWFIVGHCRFGCQCVWCYYSWCSSYYVYFCCI